MPITVIQYRLTEVPHAQGDPIPIAYNGTTLWPTAAKSLTAAASYTACLPATRDL